MAQRNWDGTVTLKTRGALASTVVGTSSKKVVTHAFNGYNGGGGGMIFAGVTGNRRIGWRVVGRNER